MIVLPMPKSTSVDSAEPWNWAGYSSAPAPMMAPWPPISRGTECSVPRPPGLVSDRVVPAKSSAVSLFARALRTSSSYAATKSPKCIVSACLMEGTSSARVPSGFGRSIARPRFTWPGCTRDGLPSTSV